MQPTLPAALLLALLAAAAPPALHAADPALGALTLEPTASATLVTPGWLARAQALNRQRERAARRAELWDRWLPTEAGDFAPADLLADAPAVRRADVATDDDAPAASLPADGARPSFAPAASGFTPTLPATAGYSHARFTADLLAAPARTRLATEGTATWLGGSPSAASLPVPVDADATSGPATMSGWAVTPSFGAAALVESRPAASVSAAAVSPVPAAITPSGAAYAWGDNQYGQLGNNSTANSSVPVTVSPSADGTFTNTGVTAIEAGQYHSLAVQNGAVYAWGRNANGQLGNNTLTNSPVPVAVLGLSTGVTGVAAGYYHSLAVQNGNVFA